MTGQVGLSVLLLVGAGLFVQTLRNLVNRDIGFNPESLLQVSLDTRGSGYPAGAGRAALPAPGRPCRRDPGCPLGCRHPQWR